MREGLRSFVETGQMEFQHNGFSIVRWSFKMTDVQRKIGWEGGSMKRLIIRLT